MAKVGAQRAAELTGKSKSTIQRAMKSGKISFERDPNGRRIIDVSELERVYGLKPTRQEESEKEVEKASTVIEIERLKMRVKFLEDQLEAANDQINDLKAQRDQWQKQASQVLITSQVSQKQAEDLREEIKERERRARERRAKREQNLEKQLTSLKAENENRTDSVWQRDDSESGDLLEHMKGFWNRMRSGA